MKYRIKPRFLLMSLLISGALTGCATTTTTKADSTDPWEGWNRGVQSFNDDVDDAILKPMAKGYLWATSDSVDEGVSNFFSNLDDIGVTVNDLLQFKMLQAGMDASRLLINTTVGVVGVFDIAKKVDLPKHNEDFGQTLGYWGIPSGPYLVLPFAGASTPRDTVGMIGDALLDPTTYLFLISGGAINAASLASSALDVTDTRAGLMTTEKIVDEGSVDRYAFIKDSYQQHREHLINDGNVPEDDGFDMMEDMEAETDGNNKEAKAAANPTVEITATTPVSPVATPTPATPDGPAVIDNSSHISQEGNTSVPPVTKHFLDLSAPQEQ